MLGPLDRTAKVGSPGRLTIVSSENHFWAKFNELSAPNAIQELDADRACFEGFVNKLNIERYSTSKLLNVLWMRELSARASKLGLNIVVNTVNPGLCASSLHRSDKAASKLVKLIAWTAAQGGHCLTDAVTLHSEDQGVYISEQELKE
jgi:retinol dehydrogenase 12